MSVVIVCEHGFIAIQCKDIDSPTLMICQHRHMLLKKYM